MLIRATGCEPPVRAVPGQRTRSRPSTALLRAGRRHGVCRPPAMANGAGASPPSAAAAANERHPGAEGDRPVLPAREEADRPGHQRVVQIMMVSKERPRRCLAANDGESDGGPSLKRPPGEATLG